MLILFSLFITFTSASGSSLPCVWSGNPLPCQGARGACSINKDGTPGGFIAEGARVTTDPGFYKGQAVRFNRAYIAPHAQVCERAEIADDAKIEEDAQILGWVVVNARTVVGSSSVLGTLDGDQITIVGTHVSIGSRVFIGNGCKISNFCEIGRSSTLGKGVFIGPQTHLEAFSHIGERSRIGKKNTFSDSVTIGKDVVIGDENFFKMEFRMGDSVQIGDSNQFQNRVHWSLRGGNWRMNSIVDCGVEIGSHNLFQGQLSLGEEVIIGNQNRIASAEWMKEKVKPRIIIDGRSEIGNANEIVESDIGGAVYVGDENAIYRCKTKDLDLGNQPDSVTWITDQCVLGNVTFHPGCN